MSPYSSRCFLSFRFCSRSFSSASFSLSLVSSLPARWAMAVARFHLVRMRDDEFGDILALSCLDLGAVAFLYWAAREVRYSHFLGLKSPHLLSVPRPMLARAEKDKTLRHNIHLPSGSLDPDSSLAWLVVLYTHDNFSVSRPPHALALPPRCLARTRLRLPALP